MVDRVNTETWQMDVGVAMVVYLNGSFARITSSFLQSLDLTGLRRKRSIWVGSMDRFRAHSRRAIAEADDEGFEFLFITLPFHPLSMAISLELLHVFTPIGSDPLHPPDDQRVDEPSLGMN